MSPGPCMTNPTGDGNPKEDRDPECWAPHLLRPQEGEASAPDTCEGERVPMCSVCARVWCA